MSTEQSRQLTDAIVKLDSTALEKACRGALASGVPAEKVLDGMTKGMDIVGQKYEDREYFLAELIMAGEVMKEGIKILQPHLKGSRARGHGKVVIGTVRGDLHDIGKDLAATLLETSGFQVIDLGVDVAAEAFVEATRREKPKIVAMSALLTVSLNEVENTVKALKETGLREKVKVIIGGAAASEQFGKKIGVDAVAADAVQGARICKEWASA
jgi:5-methyltetrahydrofolate--homocysteine methyltransferase